MSKAPKLSRQRDDLKRWDDEGGAPRSGHPSQEPPFSPEQKTEPARYYFNVRTEHGLIEDPEGDTHPSLQAARAAALAKARDLLAEGDQQAENCRSWHVEIMERANQPVLTVAFAEISDPKATSQGAGS